VFDGEISFFNDAALGITPSVSELHDYGTRLLGIDKPALSNDEFGEHYFVDLPVTGYSRVQMGDMVAIVDRAAIGPDYLPGHAHADTLSFELSLFGQRVVVNSGTSVYGSDANRQQERSTAAHSTVVIDGQDSSEVWSGFRVARRASVFDCSARQLEGVVQLSACHNGYKRLPGEPVHCREWLFEEGLLTMTDTITGTGVHQAIACNRYGRPKVEQHPQAALRNNQTHWHDEPPENQTRLHLNLGHQSQQWSAQLLSAPAADLHHYHRLRCPNSPLLADQITTVQN
jgi:hypothetical protein